MANLQPRITLFGACIEVISTYIRKNDKLAFKLTCKDCRSCFGKTKTTHASLMKSNTKLIWGKAMGATDLGIACAAARKGRSIILKKCHIESMPYEDRRIIEIESVKGGSRPVWQYLFDLKVGFFKGNSCSQGIRRCNLGFIEWLIEEIGKDPGEERGGTPASVIEYAASFVKDGAPDEEKRRAVLEYFLSLYDDYVQ